MFLQPTPLDSLQHRTLRFSPNQPYHFAATQILVPILASEIGRVAREMPILFPNQKGMPQALLGLEAGKNLHVRDTGHWMGRYIPAHFRRYPFILGEITQTEAEQVAQGRRFTVHFDAKAPHFSQSEGLRLLDDEGKPTPELENIQKMLMAMEQDMVRTLKMMDELEALQLLTPQSISLRVSGAEPRQLTGFRAIDVKVFAQLGGEQLESLRNSGTLALIHAHFLSLTNLDDGLLSQVLSAQSGTQAKVAGTDTPEVAAMLGQNGTLKFNF